MVRAMVHSIKHYNQVTRSTVTTNTTNQESIANAVESPTSANEIQEGATLKAVYIEIWTIGNDGNQFFTAIVYKRPGGVGAITNGGMALLQDYQNKKNILYTTQGLAANDGTTGPYPLYKGWIKIPKGKQRFGLGDKLTLAIASRGDGTITYCGFFTYKEYT